MKFRRLEIRWLVWGMFISLLLLAGTFWVYHSQPLWEEMPVRTQRALLTIGILPILVTGSYLIRYYERPVIPLKGFEKTLTWLNPLIWLALAVLISPLMGHKLFPGAAAVVFAGLAVLMATLFGRIILPDAMRSKPIAGLIFFFSHLAISGVILAFEGVSNVLGEDTFLFLQLFLQLPLLGINILFVGDDGPRVSPLAPEIGSSAPRTRLLGRISPENPEAGLEALKELQVFTDYTLLADLEKRLGEFPVSFFQFSPDEGEAIFKLKWRLKKEISDRLGKNAIYREKSEGCWCTRCRRRGSFQKIGSFKLFLCKQCHRDDAFLTDAVKVTGVVTEGDPKPRHSGEYRIRIWEPGTRRIIPAEIDGLRLEAIPDFHYEWFLAALLQWRDQLPPDQRPENFRVEIDDSVQLPENALRMIQQLTSKP